jgi:hypothetical protein
METSINRLKEALRNLDIVLTGKAGEILPGLVEGWA